MRSVIIAGGGWAGLAAAIELIQHGITPYLIESAPQLGGRARTLTSDSIGPDNGQHLLIGAYRETLRLMQICGIKEEKVLRRAPLKLHNLYQGRSSIIQLGHYLPAPLHMAWGIISAKGLSWRARIDLNRASLWMLRHKFSLKVDISVEQLMQNLGQSNESYRLFWEPLTLAALNTPADIASSQLLLKVLERSFNKDHHASDSLIPICGLSEILPNPAQDYIQRHNGTVQCRQRLEQIIPEKGNWLLETNRGLLACKNLILALPHRQSRRLLAPLKPMQAVVNDLNQIQNQPIITLYLQYPDSVQLPSPFIGVPGTLLQWVFDHRISGSTGLIAVVISAEGAHTKLNRLTLQKQIIEELKRHFPHWPKPIKTQILHEHHATLSASAEINQHRPKNQTTMPGLFLAGDYTNTGLPATLEGAVCSGVESARKIIENRAIHL